LPSERGDIIGVSRRCLRAPGADARASAHAVCLSGQGFGGWGLRPNISSPRKTKLGA